LKDILTRIAWDILRIYWVDTYLGPLDNIIYNTGKNFVFIEFKQYAKFIVIQVIEILVEAYNSVRKVKRYHALLRQVYKIICDKFRDTSIKINL
jgi:hypothetical protein